MSFTTGDKAAPCPLNFIERHLYALHPNEALVSNFIYVTTWAGFPIWPLVMSRARGQS